MSKRKDVIEWLVAGVKMTDDALREAYPDMADEERRRHAVLLAGVSAICGELDNVGEQISRIECGGSS